MEIRLLCPGLLGPQGAPPDGLPATPALDLLLGRSDAVDPPRQGVAGLAPDPLRTLAGAFGLETGADADLPSAALSLLADAPQSLDDAWWCHADPVHLRADRDRLLLFAGPDLAVEATEAEALVAAFNQHFADDGLVLLAPRPDRWYLRLAQGPDLLTRPLHAVVGQSVDDHLPSGADAKPWARWQTEAQMLFFSHPVAACRESTGRPALSGLWTWGGGRLPRLALGPDTPQMVVADHPLAVGLALASGLAPGQIRSLGEVGAALADTRAPPRRLVFWDAAWWPAHTGDVVAWHGALMALEGLAVGLLAGLRNGTIASLRLGDGQGLDRQIRRAGLLRLWRRGGLRALIAAQVPGSTRP